MHWLLAHFIGDYLLQNDYLAINKRTNWKVCLLHALLYLLPFLLTDLSAMQLLLIGLQHYIQDKSAFVKWYCRTTKKFQNRADIWGFVIVDNIFHIIWIQIVINFIKL
jgi:hypothetical protein